MSYSLLEAWRELNKLTEDNLLEGKNYPDLSYLVETPEILLSIISGGVIKTKFTRDHPDITPEVIDSKTDAQLAAEYSDIYSETNANQSVSGRICLGRDLTKHAYINPSKWGWGVILDGQKLSDNYKIEPVNHNYEILKNPKGDHFLRIKELFSYKINDKIYYGLHLTSRPNAMMDIDKNSYLYLKDLINSQTKEFKDYFGINSEGKYAKELNNNPEATVLEDYFVSRGEESMANSKTGIIIYDTDNEEANKKEIEWNKYVGSLPNFYNRKDPIEDENFIENNKNKRVEVPNRFDAFKHTSEKILTEKNGKWYLSNEMAPRQIFKPMKIEINGKDVSIINSFVKNYDLAETEETIRLKLRDVLKGLNIKKYLKGVVLPEKLQLDRKGDNIFNLKSEFWQLGANYLPDESSVSNSFYLALRSLRLIKKYLMDLGLEGNVVWHNSIARIANSKIDNIFTRGYGIGRDGSKIYSGNNYRRLLFNKNVKDEYKTSGIPIEGNVDFILKELNKHAKFRKGIPVAIPNYEHIKDEEKCDPYALIYKHEDKICRLCTRILLFRPSQNPSNVLDVAVQFTKDKYITLPGGGLDFEETPRDGIIREVLEETGYDLSDSGRWLTYEKSYIKHTGDEWFKKHNLLNLIPEGIRWTYFYNYLFKCFISYEDSLKVDNVTWKPAYEILNINPNWKDSILDEIESRGLEGTSGGLVNNNNVHQLPDGRWIMNKNIHNPNKDQINPKSYINNVTTWSYSSTSEQNARKALSLADQCAWNYNKWVQLMRDNNLYTPKHGNGEIEVRQTSSGAWVFDTTIRNPEKWQINPNSYHNNVTRWRFQDKSKEKVKKVLEFAKKCNWNYEKWNEYKNSLPNEIKIPRVRPLIIRGCNYWVFEKAFVNPEESRINYKNYNKNKNMTTWKFASKNKSDVEKALQLAVDCNWNYSEWEKLLKDNGLRN